MLGPTPDEDRLERCTLTGCDHHLVELEWVRKNPQRLAAYNEQVRRYDLGRHLAAQVEQGGLL